jgi:hypothetical protein
MALAGMVLSAHHFWPPLREQYRYLAWQRRCMGYDRPASMVVYDDDPNYWKTLGNHPGFGPVYFGPITMPLYNPPFGHMPPVWAENPAAWICSDGSWQGAFPDRRENLAFLHGRRSPSGHERLVAVKFVAILQWQSGCDIHLLGAAYQLAGWRPGSNVQRLLVKESNPATWSRNALLLIPNRTQGLSRSQVLAGQADPADESRFTVRYTIDGAQGDVEGRLNDDDTISLRVLDGPATRAAQPPATK